MGGVKGKQALFILTVAKSEPEFISPVQNVTVTVGQTARLTCEVKHLGLFKVYIDRSIICLIKNDIFRL